MIPDAAVLGSTECSHKRHNNGQMPDSDEDLFRAAVGDVREVRSPDRVVHTRKPKPTTRMAQQDERAALREFQLGLDEHPLGADETLSYRSSELPSTAWNRLRRGEYSAMAELDLHHYSLAAATRELSLFLREAVREEIACVLIIHGKGRGSESIPQIKNLVNQRLRHDNHILGFHSAPSNRGGEGAVYVLLKRRSRA